MLKCNVIKNHFNNRLPFKSFSYSLFGRCSVQKNEFANFYKGFVDKLEIHNSISNNIPSAPVRPEFKKIINDKIAENHAKFSLPFGWGWCYPFVKVTTTVLLSIKASTGLPWLSFFVLSAVAIRILMFPLVIAQVVSINKVSKITPNVRLLYQCAKDSNLSKVKKSYYFLKACFKYCKDIKVNPFLFLSYNLLQVPIFFLMIFSIRKISFEHNLTGEGMLWFKNLNEPDPYMILPIAAALITYYNLGRGITKENEHWVINRLRSMAQILQLLYLPFTCLWPSGTHVYWITSTSLIFLQGSLMRHPIFLKRINPTFYEDMQRVFRTEKSKEDSIRYIHKLKKCEDPIIKSPTSYNNVEYELKYEMSKMKQLKKVLFAKQVYNNTLKRGKSYIVSNKKKISSN